MVLQSSSYTAPPAPQKRVLSHIFFVWGGENIKYNFDLFYCLNSWNVANKNFVCSNSKIIWLFSPLDGAKQTEKFILFDTIVVVKSWQQIWYDKSYCGKNINSWYDNNVVSCCMMFGPPVIIGGGAPAVNAVSQQGAVETEFFSG